MPELPEVETYVRALDPLLAGVSLNGARIIWPKVAAHPPGASFGAAIIGRTIQRVWRRAKYLVFDLDKGTLLIHLRMTGKLTIEGAKVETPRHMTLAIGLEGGKELRFIDYRKFGRAWVVDDPDEVLGRLGPEPLAASFTAHLLAQRMEGRRGRLKPLLLDQRFIAGLGNIYADEALHRARLHPLTTADSLDRSQVRALHRSIRAVLKEAIGQGGTTFQSFVGPEGQAGRYHQQLRVFGRSSRNCPRRGCPGNVQRIKVAQRSTHFCPVCQPASTS